MPFPPDTLALEALRASDMWLRLLIEEMEIDPEETALEVDAVNASNNQRRPLARPTLAERLASNAALLNPK